MKRLKLLLVLLLSLSLTGCVQEFKLTDTQSDAIAEYMAGTLLRYDKNYKQDLIPLEDMGGDYSIEATLDTKKVSIGTFDKNSDTSEITNDATLSEVIGEEGFSVHYNGYKAVESYSENPDSFSLPSADGNQLLVAKFTVKNNTKNQKTINLIKSGVSYQLIMNNGDNFQPILTLLENDLQYIDIEVAAGKSEEVLLVFEVSKDLDLSNMLLKATKGSKLVTIEVK